MKLFQRLLVAPAALGLMAPVAVNADTAFTSTTTLSGNAYFTAGSVADGGTDDTQEEMHMIYAYGLELNSSFTGEDSLVVGIETGNATEDDVLASMDSAVAGGNTLTVDTMYYNFPVGDLAVTVGPRIDQDTVVAATASAYSDTFRLGAMPFSLAGDEKGPGVGVAYAADNGFVASASYLSVEGSTSTTGIGADDADDVSTLTLGYNGDGFGGGIVIASNDGDKADVNNVGTGYDTFGAGIYYSPEAFDATFSVAYDSKDPETGEDETDLFFGVDYAAGPGTLSIGYNSKDVEDSLANDQTGFEVSYSYPVNDNLTITPGYFTIEETTANQEDDTGVVVEAAFSF